jgi:hypothetical protein
MIAKGNLHGNGAKLAAYLTTGEKGETAELVETRGLDGFGGNHITAFAIMQQIAESQTNSTKAFFHSQTRNAPGEHLTKEQWLEIADRQEKRLGFAGQPRVVSFHHLPDGSTHMHAAWFRIDLETMRAIDPGMFKNHLKELSRKLEKEFALREVSSHRAADDKTRAPDRKELEESRRLNTNLKEIRNTILRCWQQSDNGRSFNAALIGQKLVLANGDRRDCYVVIDQAGGQHALNKKLTGLTLAETRQRLGDLNRGSLPSVEKAQTQQRDRAQQLETPRQPEAPRQPEPVTPPVTHWDREADNTAWQEAVATAAIQVEAAKNAPARDAGKDEAAAFFASLGPQPEPFFAPPVQRSEKDQAAARGIYARLNPKPQPAPKVPVEQLRQIVEQQRPASAIESMVADALNRTLTGKEFTEAIGFKGLTIARATDRDVTQIDRLKKDDLAVVTSKGNVFRLSVDKVDYARIARRLAKTKTPLPGVIEARAMNERSQQETAKLWETRRAESIDHREIFEAGKVLRQDTKTAERAVHLAFNAPAKTIEQGARTTGRALSGLANAFESVISGIFGLFAAAPKKTAAQVRDEVKAESNLETLHARGFAAEELRRLRFSGQWDKLRTDRSKEA